MDERPPEVPAGFELLADEKRARILYALAESLREADGDPSLGFAELRERAGIRDSGNFNYHLGELRGRFVKTTEDGDGYVLTYPGMALVAALVRGDYADHEPLGPAAYGEDCPVCGTPLSVYYEQGILRVDCEHDHAMGYNLPAHAVDPDDLTAAVELMTRRVYAEMALVLDGRCTMCFGEVSVDVLDVDDEALAPSFEAVCARCGMHYHVRVGQAVVHHPDVVAFYADRGVDVRTATTTLLSLGRDDVVTQVGEDPARFEVTVAADGDELVVTVDDAASVVAVEGP